MLGGSQLTLDWLADADICSIDPIGTGSESRVRVRGWEGLEPQAPS
jgi:hypothetical protein